MAADPTLARGAYLAAKNDDSATKSAMRYVSGVLREGSEKLGAKKAMKESASSSAPSTSTTAPKSTVDEELDVNIQEEVEHKNSEEGQAEDETDEVIDSGDLDGENQESTEQTRNELEENKEIINEAIVNGDTATEEALLQNLDEEKINKDNIHEAFANHATDWTNRSKEKGNIHTPHGYGMGLDKDPEAKAWVMDMTRNPNRTITRKKEDSEGNIIGTETGVIGPNGEFLNGKQLQSKLAEYEVDNESFLAFNDLANGFKKQGLEGDPKSTFDGQAAKVAVTDIINNGNIRSLKYDANFGGTSFADDLKKGNLLQGKRYSDLGIKQVGNDDIISADDELSQEDKDSVVDAYLSSDSDVIQAEVKESLIGYFTEHAHRNWTRGNAEVRARHDQSSAQPIMDDYTKYQEWKKSNPNGTYSDFTNDGWENPDINSDPSGMSGELNADGDVVI